MALPDGSEADVAIVGGGPAGLAAAIALRKRGIGRIVVLERNVEAGGIPRQCGHPPYGLREFGRVMTGPTYAARLRETAAACGVEILTHHSVTALEPGGALMVASPERVARLVARRVILATGAREMPRSARLLSGDRPGGVMNTATLQDSLYLRGLRPFARPVVVGTELVGLSAVWTCLRHGIRPAAVIEADARSVARFPLGLFPTIVGIPVFYRATLLEIVGRARVEAVRIAIAGVERRIACDGVILSGSFLPDAPLVHASHLAVAEATGGPRVDHHGRCSDPAYFACGNILRPIETAGWCYREGRHVGEHVADDLAGRLGPAPIALIPGDGVRWVVPQQVASDMDRPIQLRAAGPIAGRLALRQEGRLVWSRRIRTRAERRIQVPAGALRALSGDAPVTIAIER